MGSCIVDILVVKKKNVDEETTKKTDDSKSERSVQDHEIKN